MAQVTGKSSIRIDELINSMVVSGNVDETTHQLLLKTLGGAVIPAGEVGGIPGPPGPPGSKSVILITKEANQYSDPGFHPVVWSLLTPPVYIGPDASADFGPGTNNLLVKNTGWYEISGQIRVTSLTSAGRIWCSLVLGTSTPADYDPENLVVDFDGPATAPIVSFKKILPVTAGQRIYFTVNNSEIITIGKTHTIMQIERLS